MGAVAQVTASKRNLSGGGKNLRANQLWTRTYSYADTAATEAEQKGCASAMDISEAAERPQQ